MKTSTFVIAGLFALAGLLPGNTHAGDKNIRFGLNIGGRSGGGISISGGRTRYQSNGSWGHNGHSHHGGHVYPQRPVVVTPPIYVGTQTTQLPRQSYVFGAMTHLDSLAIQMEQQASAIAWSMHTSHRHNPGFAETYSEAYQMAVYAKHIHQLVDQDQYRQWQRGSVRDLIARDLFQIDQLFHHIEGDVAPWAPSFNHGHHHVDDLRLRMAQFEATLHHLMEDYGVHSQLVPGNSPPPLPSNGPPLYVP